MNERPDAYGLPGYVNVGPMRYKVEIIEDLIGTGDDNQSIWINGKVCTYKGHILIDRDIHDDAKKVVLIHEILHAILTQAGIRDEPENVIEALGFGLLNLVRRNPYLWDCLRDKTHALHDDAG